MHKVTGFQTSELFPRFFQPFKKVWCCAHFWLFPWLEKQPTNRFCHLGMMLWRASDHSNGEHNMRRSQSAETGSQKLLINRVLPEHSWGWFMWYCMYMILYVQSSVQNVKCSRPSKIFILPCLIPLALPNLRGRISNYVGYSKRPMTWHWHGGNLSLTQSVTLVHLITSGRIWRGDRNSCLWLQM